MSAFAILAPPRKQRGVAAIEFALVGVIFFVLFFGIVELARVLYICNTLQEVTRRGAALAVNTDFSNDTAMQKVREQAIFRASEGGLVFGDPVTDKHVRIDYLSVPANAGTPVSATMPDNPRDNRVNCTSNPNAANCIQLVRVRICGSDSAGASCTPVPYRRMFSLIPIAFSLPDSTTIAKIETLGAPPGMPVSPTAGPAGSP